MSRYTLPDPKCRHVPRVRISSHADLTNTGTDAVASTYCCDRPACQDDAKEWVYASSHRVPVVVPLEAAR